MRRLIVIRHAKAERTSERGDHGRRLSERGIAQASALREWTKPGGPLGDVRGTVVVSDAARTLETFELALSGTGACTRAVVDPWLYNGARDVSTDDVLASLAAADPGAGDLIHVGHNPTVAYLVHDLCEDEKGADRAMRDGFSLCAVAVLEFDGASPEQSGCRLAFFAAPTPLER